MKNTVTTKISKWGNGYGVRIPKAIIKSQLLEEGQEVVLTSLPEEGILLERLAPSIESMTVEELFAGFNDGYSAEECKEIEEFFGKPQGREIW